MLNTLSTPTADPDGYIELQVSLDTTNGESRRRVTRVATLDGSAVLSDGGYSEADRTIDLIWQTGSEPRELNIERLVQLYPQIQVATRAGVYLAAPESYRPGPAETRLRLLVVEKLSN